jgi:hypothetical protein
MLFTVGCLMLIIRLVRSEEGSKSSNEIIDEVVVVLKENQESICIAETRIHVTMDTGVSAATPDLPCRDEGALGCSLAVRHLALSNHGSSHRKSRMRVSEPLAVRRPLTLLKTLERLAFRAEDESLFYLKPSYKRSVFEWCGSGETSECENDSAADGFWFLDSMDSVQPSNDIEEPSVDSVTAEVEIYEARPILPVAALIEAARVDDSITDESRLPVELNSCKSRDKCMGLVPSDDFGGSSLPSNTASTHNEMNATRAIRELSRLTRFVEDVALVGLTKTRLMFVNIHPQVDTRIENQVQATQVIPFWNVEHIDCTNLPARTVPDNVSIVGALQSQLHVEDDIAMVRACNINSLERAQFERTLYHRCTGPVVVSQPDGCQIFLVSALAEPDGCGGSILTQYGSATSLTFPVRLQLLAAEFMITLDELSEIDSRAFCFYRCLKKSDRQPFVSCLFKRLCAVGDEAGISAFSDELALDLTHLSRGGIPLYTWISVMESCARAGELNNDYVLHSVSDGAYNAHLFKGIRCQESVLVELLFYHNHLGVIKEYRTGGESDTRQMEKTDRSSAEKINGSTLSKHAAAYKPKSGLLVAYGNSIPTAQEHALLEQEFRQSPIVARFKTPDGKNSSLLEETILMDIFETLKQKLTSRFTYVRCLDIQDQRPFAQEMMKILQQKAERNELRAEEVLARVASGGISLTLWVKVMQQCAAKRLLHHNYTLFRRAYWGENSHDFTETTIYSFYHCKVADFVVGGVSSGRDDTPASAEESIPILFDGYGYLSRLSYWFLNPSQFTDPDRELPSVTVY